ncbi:CBS domain-containing protein [Oxyplasma meridianum]|uniref:CBS domain-containing protein n=1 Tax=Oxyplasma meridianum TaxID=3073602 RepID=A0AAX4NIX6_9ARCH
MKVEDIMTADPIVMEAEDTTLTDAMSKMRDSGIHQVPLVKNREYYGMVYYRDILRRRSVSPKVITVERSEYYRDILRRRSLQMKSKIGHFAVLTPYLNKGMDVLEAVEILRDSGLFALPVLEKEKIVGILSETDLVAHIRDLTKADSVNNISIMSTEPITVQEDEDLESATEKVRGLNESEIPVVDKNGKLKGLLRGEEYTLNMILAEKQKMAKGDLVGNREKVEVKCGSVMGNPVMSTETASILDSAEKLIKNHTRIIPIVDEHEKVVGIVGISDIIDIINTGEEIEGILVKISGLDSWDDDLYDVASPYADIFVSMFLPMYGKISHGSMRIHVAKYMTEGNVKYSIRTRLSTDHYHLNVNNFGWDFERALLEVFDAYEERMRKLAVK